MGTTRVEKPPRSASPSHCHRGCRWPMIRAPRTSRYFEVSHRRATRQRSIRFFSTTVERPLCKSRHSGRFTTITRTPSNRRLRSSTPSQNSSEPARASFLRARSGGLPLADRRLSCPVEERPPSVEDAVPVDAPSSRLQEGHLRPCHSGPMLTGHQRIQLRPWQPPPGVAHHHV